jgi:hypothetical protein
MIEKLLARCVHETDSGAKSFLGKCLGEVGAIGEHRLRGVSMGTVLGPSDSLDADASCWRLTRPPWKSKSTEYELELVKRHLVIALKAATSASDLNKVAFSIQQLLKLLDKPARPGVFQAPGARRLVQEDPPRPTMSDRLRQLLDGAFETVEPFWSTSFKEVRSLDVRP